MLIRGSWVRAPPAPPLKDFSVLHNAKWTNRALTEVCLRLQKETRLFKVSYRSVPALYLAEAAPLPALLIAAICTG